MGHARASTTLNLYTHAPEDYDERVRQVISGSADFSLTLGLTETPKMAKAPPERGSDLPFRCAVLTGFEPATPALTGR